MCKILKFPTTTREELESFTGKQVPLPLEEPAEVVDILEHQPHMDGAAVCLHCSHTWQAVAPVGTAHLECPSCGLGKGVYARLVSPDRYYECACGCRHFCITEDFDAVCTHCGRSHLR